MEGLFQRCSQEDMELFAGIARRIWLRRNDILHGGFFSSPQAIITHAKNGLSEFQAIQEGSRTSLDSNGPVGLAKWKSPSPGSMLLFFPRKVEWGVVW